MEYFESSSILDKSLPILKNKGKKGVKSPKPIEEDVLMSATSKNSGDPIKVNVLQVYPNNAA
jgi:hypothetical protein